MGFCARLKNCFKIETTTTDNFIFRLHYRATTITLIAISIYVACRQYIGDPIDCISKDDIPTNLLDTFCWIHTTFSLPEAWEKKVGNEIPYPGLDKYHPNEKRVYHAYYQWVCLVLFLQAILFYVPRFFWKAVEGGRIKSLTLGLNSPILPQDTKIVNKNLLVEHMVANMSNSNFYFMSYVLAEIMNFVNVIVQIFLVDVFLGGQFLTYGAKVITFSGWDWSLQYDPMLKIFPRLAKCTFYRYGSSGDVQRHDAMCILSMNIINEKIYLFLWFWFIVLAALSGLVLLYHAVIALSMKSRLMVTRFHARLANKNDLEVIIKKCKLGDWFILNLLSKNLDPLNLRDVIKDFAERLNSLQSD